MNKDRILGIVALLGSGVALVTASALNKVIRHIPAGETVVFIGIWNILVICLPVITFQGGTRGEGRGWVPPGLPHSAREWVMLGVRGFLAPTAYTTFFYTLKVMPFGDATAIDAINPIFAAIFGRIFLKERFGIYHLISVVLGFVGVVMLVKPTIVFGGDVSPYPVYVPLLGVGAAVGIGATTCLQRKLSLNNISPIVSVMAVNVGNIFAGVVFDVVMRSPPVSPGCYGDRWLLVGIILASNVCTLLYAVGLQYQEASVGSVLRNLDILTAYLVQLVLFRERITPVRAAGAVCVAIATVVIVIASTQGKSKECLNEECQRLVDEN